jgi:amino acid adenylation domain-containing protein
VPAMTGPNPLPSTSTSADARRPDPVRPTASAGPAGLLTLTGLIAPRIAAWPTATALVDAIGPLTYAELGHRANAIAARLLAAGVERGEIVGVLLERSTAMVAAWLGILRAGAAYLPLDDAQPPSRLRHLLMDCSATFLVSSPEKADLADGLGVPMLKIGGQDWSWADPGTVISPAITPQDLAYVIYTSGTTGGPKGAMIEHRNIVNTAVAHADTFGIAPGDRVGQVSACGFDVAGEEIWGNLAAGAEIHIMPEAIRRSPDELCRWVVERELVGVDLTTAVATLAIRHGWLAGSRLRLLLTGGEKLLVRPPVGAGYRLVNGYGSTETTVIATWAVVEPEHSEVPTIGEPISGVSAYVLDPHGDIVPDGADGELYIGGAGVGRGYLRRPGLTARCFVPDPASNRPGSRRYRTGDLVRRCPDGRLEFRGRLDAQAKVNGFRIEPGEVEEALRAHPSVAEAAVKVWQPHGGYPRLAGYVSGAPDLDADSLRSWLAERLPTHLVPAVVMVLPALPMTLNQKLDRDMLPDPATVTAPNNEAGFNDPLERDLANDWRLACGVLPHSGQDTLVALGAGSLDLVALRIRVADRLDRDMPPAALGLTQTLTEQARLMADLEPAMVRATPGRARQGRGSLGQEALVFLEEMHGTSLGYQYQMLLEGPGAPDPRVLERALRAVVASQPALACRWRLTAPGLTATPGPLEALRLPEHEVADEASAEALVAKLVTDPIRYEDFPLIRWDLIRHGHGTMLVQRENHIVHDGWSVGLFLGRLMNAYEAYDIGLDWQPEDCGVSYFDWALSQREAMAGADVEPDRQYWRDQLALLGPESWPAPTQVSAAALDSPASSEPAVPRSRVLVQPLGHVRSAEIERVAARLSVTVFALLLATFRQLLHPGPGGRPSLIGTSFANRDLHTRDVIGLFVNVLPLIQARQSTETPAEAARAEMAVVAEAARHQLPTTEVMWQLPPGLRPAQGQLYPVLFSMHDSPRPELRFGGWRPRLRELANGFGKTSLEVIGMNEHLQHIRSARGSSRDADGSSEYSLWWQHDPAHWSDAEIRDLQHRFEAAIDHALAKPDRPWPTAPRR